MKSQNKEKYELSTAYFILYDDGDQRGNIEKSFMHEGTAVEYARGMVETGCYDKVWIYTLETINVRRVR